MAGTFQDKERVIARCITHVREVVDAIEALCDQTTLDNIERALFPPPTATEKVAMLTEARRLVLHSGEDAASDILKAVDARVMALTVELKQPKEIDHEVEETARHP